MTFDDELNLLSSDSQTILSHQSVTIKRIRPDGDPDPATFERTQNVEEDTLDAVPLDPIVTTNELGHRVTLGQWIVRVADTTFRPSARGELFTGSQKWRIVTVQDHLDGREYLITAERTA